MSEPCCYQDPDTGKLRGSGCHGGFEACGTEPRCCYCGQIGHLSKDCPAEKWPRFIEDVCSWMLIAILSFGIVVTVAWIGMLL